MEYDILQYPNLLSPFILPSRILDVPICAAQFWPGGHNFLDDAGEWKKRWKQKNFFFRKKSSLSSPLPPIRLPLCSYTSSPESPTPWWNRRVKHEKRYTMKCTFLCLHVYAWIEYIWYNMSKYLPRSRAPSSGRNGPSLHPRNPQAGSAAAKNCFGLDKLELVGSSNPNFFGARMLINSFDQSSISSRNSYLAQNGKVERILKNVLIVFLWFCSSWTETKCFIFIRCKPFRTG